MASRISVDRLIADALDALGGVVPFDLATVMQLDGDALRVRVARGPLRSRAVQRHGLKWREHPGLVSVLREGAARAFEDHGPDDADPFDGVLELPHGHFCMVAPLRARDTNLGIVTVDRRTCGVADANQVALMGVFGRLLAVAIETGEDNVRLAGERNVLEQRARDLARRLDDVTESELLEASRSPAMRAVVATARQVASSTAPMLLLGETGTGKDVLAGAIHAWSPRRGGPLVRVNCAALPGAIIESELFGHVRGAFSGATTDRPGRFVAARGGTLFLDEIGELPLELQAKLLRALQSGTFEPVGSDRTVSSDARVVSATNRDLAAEVSAGRFREDLYWRLAVVPIVLPPLRARPEDVLPIARGVLERIQARTGRGPFVLDERAAAALSGRLWPGNVRELIHAIERATLLSEWPVLRFDSPPVPPTLRASRTLEEVEREHIVAVLHSAGGRVHGAGGAAQTLGLHPNTLLSRMKKLRLGGARAYKAK